MRSPSGVGAQGAGFAEEAANICASIEADSRRRSSHWPPIWGASLKGPPSGGPFSHVRPRQQRFSLPTVAPNRSHGLRTAHSCCRVRPVCGAGQDGYFATFEVLLIARMAGDLVPKLFAETDDRVPPVNERGEGRSPSERLISGWNQSDSARGPRALQPGCPQGDAVQKDSEGWPQEQRNE